MQIDFRRVYYGRLNLSEISHIFLNGIAETELKAGKTHHPQHFTLA